MAHVVTEPCILCKYTDCVDVCPVDCFREGPNFLVIDPDECIDWRGLAFRNARPTRLWPKRMFLKISRNLSP